MVRLALLIALTATAAAHAAPPKKEALAWNPTAVEPGTQWWCGPEGDSECLRDEAECKRRMTKCHAQRTVYAYEWGSKGEANIFDARRSAGACATERKATLSYDWAAGDQATACRAVGAVKPPPVHVAPGTGFTCFTFTIADTPGSSCYRTDPQKCEQLRSVTGGMMATRVTSACEPRDTAYATQRWDRPDENALLAIDRATCEAKRSPLLKSLPCVLVK